MKRLNMQDKSESTEEIVHKGTVLRIEGVTATVRITDKGECEACAAAALCNGGNRNGIEISAFIPSGLRLTVGDTVEVSGTEQLHRKAIRLVTVYPTLAILAVMIGCYLLTGNQLLAAMSGLATMILFFVVLWLCKNRLAHEFTFTVKSVCERNQ